MRFPLRFLGPALFLALASVVSASDVTLVRVLPEWRDAASFKRISEYFTGRENTGDTTVVRTHPEERSGFYFLMRVQHTGATATAAKVEIHLITPTEPKPKAYAFDATLQPGKNLLNLGLTGEDWTDPKANPVAWKVDVLAADGTVLASQKSYLWERPTTATAPTAAAAN